MKKIITLIFIACCIVTAHAQKQIDLYHLLKQFVPDSNYSDNINAYYLKVSQSAYVKSGRVPLDIGTPADFKLTKKDNQYKTIEIACNISPEDSYPDIKSLMPQNDYEYKSYIDCSDDTTKAFFNVFAYEVKLPGKMKVWLAYWYETGNGYGHFWLRVFLNEADAPKKCIDIQ